MTVPCGNSYKHPPSLTLIFIEPFRASYLSNSHVVITKHSLPFFHPFSSFFLQEPQTTVIHNPVDGTKVHPPPPSPPPPPSISLSLHFSSSSSLSFCVGSLLQDLCFEFLCVHLFCICMHGSGGASVSRRSCGGGVFLTVVLHCPSVFRLMELTERSMPPD